MLILDSFRNTVCTQDCVVAHQIVRVSRVSRLTEDPPLDFRDAVLAGLDVALRRKSFYSIEWFALFLRGPYPYGGVLFIRIVSLVVLCNSYIATHGTVVE